MNIFKQLFTKELKLPSFGQLFSMPRMSVRAKQDGEYLKEYKNWVYTCINARAEEVASTELYVVDINTGEEVENHPILKLLDDVNPNTTRYDLFYLTQAFLDLVGNEYWYLARDAKGVVREIYPIAPDQMEVVVSKENPLIISGYLYGQKGNQTPFEANEILHFKNFNPLAKYPTPHKGVGIVEMALWAVETDNEARNWNYSFFKNSARPDGLLTTETTLTDKQFDRVKEQWTQKHQGSSNNGKTAILEGGLKWQDVAKTQKEMDFIAQRTFSRDEILSIFRVPKTVVGITDDVNRANAEASDYIFARRTIKPLMEKFVNTLNEYLMPEYGKANHVLKFRNPVPQDRLTVIQEYSLGINKWLTRNDIRRVEGLEPSQSGDTFYASFGEAPQDVVNVPIKGKTAVSKAVTKSDDVIDDFIARLPKKKELSKIKDTQKTIFKEVYIKRFDENEKALIVDVKKYFINQEAEVIKNLEDEYSGLKPKEYKLKGIDDVIFDEKKAIATGISLITPHLRNFLNQGAELADNISDGEYNPNDVASLTFIQERAKFFAESITKTTAEALIRSLGEGLDSGEGVEDLKKRINEVYQYAEAYRTEVIARTEVSASLNEGAVQAYKQAGIEHLEWVAIGDDKTAEICLANDGQVRKIGEAFPSGEAQPPNHVNCRCSIVAVRND